MNSRQEEAQEYVSKAVREGTAKRMKYVGKPALTRGTFGSYILYGYLVDGYIYVWDADWGWISWTGSMKDFVDP